jgi:hypothetical protein
MTRSCLVCSHPDAVEINEALIVEGVPNRRVAARYELSETTVRRHREHIPELLVEASNHESIYGAEEILGKIEDLQRETLEQLEGAKGEDDRRLVLHAIREARHNLELVAKVRQLINDAPQINIALSPEWIRVRGVIVGALEEHPEARGSVLRAIEGVTKGS